jgi:hypothetical protein
LSDELKVDDLSPMPVRSIDKVAGRFRSIARSHVDDVRMVIEVTR